MAKFTTMLIFQHSPEPRTIRRTITRAGLNAYEAVYEPCVNLDQHEHDAPFFTYVLRGNYVEGDGLTSKHCERGAVIFHDHHEVHSNAVGPHGTASLNVEIALELWRELTGDVLRKRDVVGRVLSGDVEWSALAVWREFHEADSASVLGLSESVALLCWKLIDSHERGSFEPHRRLERCVEYLSAHHAEFPTLAQVARIADVHPMHLAKLFRKRFGYSMGEFIRRQRIAWACEQLCRSTGTISSIALESGFADHAHFTRTFRRITGSTPRWYRDHIPRNRINPSPSIPRHPRPS
jgi:AraC family transcriptional regulator